MRGRSQLKVWLADLGHTYYGISPSTVPLGIGYLAATLRREFGERLAVRLYKYPERLLADVRSGAPDVLGFGLYCWNAHLCGVIAAKAKDAWPGLLTVAGGLSVPLAGPELHAFSRAPENRRFDCFLPGEAEWGMVALVRRLMEGGDWPVIGEELSPGIWIRIQNALAGQAGPALVEDLASVPSPYLDGVLDRAVADPALTPVLQTMRGCPYACTFCVGGGIAYAKLRQFPLERVKEEIRYLHNRAANPNLRLTDENFGVFQRDVEIAEFIARCHRDHGYPASVKVYTDKRPNERVRAVMEALSTFIPFNISLQTTTVPVLREIKRRNIPVETVREGFRWAKQHGMTTATEILHGFPGESFKSFLACVDQVFDLRIDSVSSHEVWLLPNTPLASDESRCRNQLRSKHALGADALSLIDGEPVFETDEHVVATADLTEDEHYALCKLDFFIGLSLTFGGLRELVYHAAAVGIAPTALYTELTDHPRRYPVLTAFFDRYVAKVRASHAESRAGLGAQLAELFRGGGRLEPTRILPVVIGQCMFGAQWGSCTAEVAAAVTELARGLPEATDSPEWLTEFRRATTALAELIQLVVISPLQPLEKCLTTSFRYDIHAWAADAYRAPLLDYRVGEALQFHAEISDFDHIRRLIADGQSLTTEDERIQHFLRHLTSSSRRRRLRLVAAAPDAGVESRQKVEP